MTSFPILCGSKSIIISSQAGHFLQLCPSQTHTQKDLCGCIVSPVYKCHNKKFKIPGDLQATSGNNKNIHVYKFVSLPVSDLSPCGLCQIEEMSHLPEAPMPPASLSWCAFHGVWLVHFEKPHWKNNFFCSSLSSRKLPVHANTQSQG